MADSRSVQETVDDGDAAAVAAVATVVEVVQSGGREVAVGDGVDRMLDRDAEADGQCWMGFARIALGLDRVHSDCMALVEYREHWT